MFCPQCGKERFETDKYCASCGTSLGSVTTSSPSTNTSKNNDETVTPIVTKVDTKPSVKKSIIDGRMARKEFAWITFAPYLLAIVTMLMTGITALPIIIAWFFFGYFAAIRRLHDINKSAWYLLLIGFSFSVLAIKEGFKMNGVDTMNFDITILGIVINIMALAGFILLIFLVFVAGTKGENKYGQQPLSTKLNWRSILFNLQKEGEVLDKTYFYTTAAIFTGIILLIVFLFIS
jgi:uncharacterized membrane protein YhaH (DUF805 family)/ribosomal protein L37E